MTYKQFIIYFVCWFLPCCAEAKDAVLDSLLQLIDADIARSEYYVGMREGRIAQLHARYGEATTDRQRYELAFKLYEEYKPLVNDSALHYLDRCIALATRMQRPALADECRAIKAQRCSNIGMYDEALSLLHSINREGLEPRGLGIYYCAMGHVYGELAYYTRLPEMRHSYGTEAERYRQLALKTMPEFDNNRMQTLELFLMGEGRYKASKALNDKWLAKVEKGSHPYALVTFYRYLEYQAEGDTTMMMRWLGESVLADLRNGVTDQGSMWEMANQLVNMGQVDRAYRYITYATDCAARFGSRQRLTQISPIMAEIANRYKAESEANYSRLKLTLSIISVLALLVLASFFYVNRQRRHLAEARNDLARNNAKLSALNHELSLLNAQMAEANRRLTDANRVKEEYVGRLMRLCSTYVDRLDDFRRKVARLLKARQYDELRAVADSSQFKDSELDELYANFDSAFLHLFPHFVEEFNALLRPEEQVVLPDALRLNTMVRIFALIRLGIDDSSKIAEFLHYSVNTIYNYRARVKNAALSDRDTFEERVKQIGTGEVKK